MFEDEEIDKPRGRKPQRLTQPDDDADKRFASVDAPCDWSKQSPETLMRWYEEIRTNLPPIQLSRMNLEEEMLLQFHTLRILQTKVIDDDTPVNQKSQLINSVSSALRSITEKQTAVYSSERFKAIELLLIRVLNKLPEDSAAAFLDDYEKILEVHSQNLS